MDWQLCSAFNGGKGSTKDMIGMKSPIMKRQNRKQQAEGRWTEVANWIQVHLPTLTWAVPLAMIILVIGYELGPARWIHQNLGFNYHLLAELALFGTLGPALTYGILHLLGRWLEERDTSELQAQLLARTRAEAEGSRQLNDDALQVLFAAGMLIDTLKTGNDALPPEMLAQIEETEQALQAAVGQLREHLLRRQL